MAALQTLFDSTGGPDPSSTAIVETAPTASFLKAFESNQNTGANGSGPILNANAVLLPTRTDQYRDTSNYNDFRLHNGLGVSKAFRKPDSMAGATEEGFHGAPKPTKLFGRSTKTFDQNLNRDDHNERARMNLKTLGSKPNETPDFASYKPWEWNNIQALGIGTHGNQYNRHYGIPDADGVTRRLYEPTPSRKTQMLTTDVENAALRPQKTAMHPVTVVSQDRQREKEYRIPRNADVAEAVLYEKGMFPRGMGGPNGNQAVRVWGDASVLRIPVGSNDTGDKSIHDIWRNGRNVVGSALAAETHEDLLRLYLDSKGYIEGKSVEREAREFAEAEAYLNSRPVPDPVEVEAYEGEYPHNQSTANGPLTSYPTTGYDS